MPLKNFVLDTNVLLHDPQAIFAFADNLVNVPIVVIEEIDTFKRNASELGRSARQISRSIDVLRERGSLTDGVPLDNGGRLRVILGNGQVPKVIWASHEPDNRIMAAALHLQRQEPDTPTILVTKDVNLRIRADALGIDAEDYDTERISVDEMYSGSTEVQLSEEQFDELGGTGATELPPDSNKGRWFENEYVTATCGRRSLLARAGVEAGLLSTLVATHETVYGIRPRNREQHFALDALLRDDVKLVTLVGKAGTGKTLLAVAAGLRKVAEEAAYHRLLVSRPIFPMGRDIGYLPGEIAQKLKPWMQPIHDNVTFLLGLQGKHKRGGRSVEDLVGRGVMEIEPLTYIRGRSIPNQFMVIDEAQNLTPHETKTILTRAGDDTKIVFTGDPYQIDNPYVDSVSNGLTYLVEHFKGQSIAATVTLRKGERSKLAELAANLL